MVAIDRLRALLSYDADTGAFTHRALSSVKSRAKIGEVAGGPRKDGYYAVKVDGRLYPAHRLAWAYVTGEWPTQQIDHINGDKMDNRFSNLRDVNTSQNKQNTRVARIDNTSGMLGAHKCAGTQKWKAQIRVDGKLKYLGLYATPAAAHEAYVLAKRKMHPAGTL